MRWLFLIGLLVSACVSKPAGESVRRPASPAVDETQPNIPDLKTVQDSAPYIISRAKLTDPQTAKMAYVGRAAYVAYYQAYYDPIVNKDAPTIHRRVQQALDTARAEVDGSDWQARYAAAATKSVLKGLSYGSRSSGEFAPVGAALDIAEPITNEVIEDVKKSLIKPGMTPTTEMLDDRQTLALSVWMYNEAQNPRSQFAKEFNAEIETRHHVQATRNLKSNEIYQREAYNNAILNQLAKEGLDVRQMVGQLRDVKEFQKAAKESAKEEFGKIKGDTDTIVQYVREERNAKVEENDRLRGRGNVTGSFEAMSALATLGGDYKTAQLMNKTAKLSGAIYDIATKKIADSFSKAPFAIVNPYLMAFTMVVDLLGSSGGGDKAMFDMLKAIQAAIENLRTEMHTRFDRLEFRMDRHFAKVYSELTNIRMDQQLSSEELNGISAKLDLLEQGQIAGFNGVLRIILTDPISKCLSPRGERVTLSEMDGCRDKFSYVAIGGLDGALKVNSNAQKYSNGFSSLRAVQEALLTSYPNDPLTKMELVDPLHWFWGARALEGMVRLHPEYRSEIAKPNVLNGDEIDLSAVISQGNNLSQFLKGMAIEHGHLRVRLFNALFNNYYSAVDHLLGLTDGKMNAEYGSGPRPGNFGAKLPELDDEVTLKNAPSFTFVNNEMHMCIGESPTLGGDYGHDFNGNEPTRANHIVSFDSGLRLHQNLVKLLPPSVGWALKLHHLNADLRGCFRKVHFSQVNVRAYPPNSVFNNQEKPYTRVKMETELELYFSYNIGSETKSFMAARLAGTYVYDTENGAWDPLVGPGLTHIMWMGGLAGTVWNITESANKNPKDWLKVVQLDGDDVARLKTFEKEYTQAFDDTRNRVDAAVDAAAGTASDEAAKARRAIQFLADYGVNSTRETLENLRTWLAEPTHLADGLEWARGMSSSGATRQEVTAALRSHVDSGMALVQTLSADKNLTPQPDMFSGQLESLRGYQRKN